MTLQPFSRSPLRWGVAVGLGLAVFLFVNITTTLVTFILPESFASTARVLLTSGSQTTTNQPIVASGLATQLELIQSELILGPAASELGLAEAWGKKYAGGEHLHASDVLTFLRARLDVRQVRNSSLAEIRAFCESPQEAADLANQIAATYCSMFQTNGARIVDRATPGYRPVRPNKPLNIAVGVLAGCSLGGLATAALLFFTRGKRTSPPPVSSSPGWGQPRH